MIVLKNCRVIDIRKGKVREGSLTIEDGRISARKRRGGADQTIDVQGCFVFPGLITCHTHLSIVFPFHETDEKESPAITALRCARRAMDCLEAGITTIRTVSEHHRADIHLRTMVEKGWAKAPRIFSAGMGISTTGGHGAGFGTLLADGPDEFRKCVRQEFAAGAQHIKIFISGGIAKRGESFDESQMIFEEVRAAVQAAKSRGSYVCAHSSGPAAISEAVGAGVLSFEHGYHLDKTVARSMKQAGCYLIPTLSVTRSPNWMKDHGFEQLTIDKAISAGSDHLESIRTAVKEGVKIVNGTDVPPGDKEVGMPMVVKEMEHMMAAGLSPLEVLKASTTVPAELIGAKQQLGVLEPGYYADLLVVKDNPLRDVSALGKPLLVMKDGEVVIRREI
jgi:imidazolonepropionase-like amidohydrolase